MMMMMVLDWKKIGWWSCTLLLLLLLLLLSTSTTVQAIWPKPRNFHQGNQLIRINPNLTISFTHHLNQEVPSPSTEVQDIIQNILHQIKTDDHQPLQKDRGKSLIKSTFRPNQYLNSLSIDYKPSSKEKETHPHLNFQSNLSASSSPSSFSISPHVIYPSEEDPHHQRPTISISREMKQPIKSRDESYELNINYSHNEYRAVLTTSSGLGILRGLQSFTQLVYTVKNQQNTRLNHLNNLPTSQGDHSSSEDLHLLSSSNPNNDGQQEDIKFIFGPVSIQDSPAFSYRGLLLDTSRNFYPISSLRETIEAMSWVKLNVLHWHIVDAQSWPFELPTDRLEKLSRLGAYSDSQVYRLEDVKDLVRFANSRGVEIMLEIDTPGHTSIIGESFPHLIACKDATPWSDYAAEPPAGQLRVANDEALDLANEIFDYVTHQVPGTFFSSGGDEVNKKCYENDHVTQATLREKNMTLSQAIKNFVIKTHETIRKSGKTPVVWEEVILDELVDLPLDTAIAVWRSSANVKDVVDKGYPIIHAASDYSYLDCGLGGWLGNSINGTSWCDPFKTWQKIYSFDPYNNVTINQRKQVLGGQALLWSEQADEQNMQSLIWPRALSTAEVYWTGSEKSRSVTEALPRIHDMRYRLVQRGIRAAPLQPHWCVLRPGQCDLPTGQRED